MESKELVTVIIPIYKVEEYIDRCVRSITHQTYENMEVILVDDGSPDNCPRICDNWAACDDRIKVIHKANGGLSSARNAGLDIATGDYIAFVDSDDYVAPEFIEVLINNAKNYNAQISCVGFQKIYSENDIQEINSTYPTKFLCTRDAIKSLFGHSGIQNYAWNKLYCRNLFDGIRYPVGKNMEDLGTTYHLVAASESVVYSPMPLYYYLQREDSILHCPNDRFYHDRMELALTRYNDLKSFMGDFEENKRYAIGITLISLPRIRSDIEMFRSCTDTLHTLWKTSRNCFTFKYKVKYILFRCFPYLYYKIL